MHKAFCLKYNTFNLMRCLVSRVCHLHIHYVSVFKKDFFFLSKNLTILNRGVKETEIWSLWSTPYVWCFVILLDKNWYLIELLTQKASALVPGSVRLVYRKDSLIPDENFSRRTK